MSVDATTVTANASLDSLEAIEVQQSLQHYLEQLEQNTDQPNSPEQNTTPENKNKAQEKNDTVTKPTAAKAIRKPGYLANAETKPK
jgi:hypothetical protein